MSKERLEEINYIRKAMREYVNPDGSVEDYPRYDEQALSLIDDGHVDWLVERVQNLESRLAFEQGVTSNLQSKNKRYREVVTQAISDLENECLWDALVKLKALEGEE